MSYKAWIQAEGSWNTNSLVFATEQEAKAYGDDLFSRWMLATGVEARKSDEEINHRFVNRILERIEAEV